MTKSKTGNTFLRLNFVCRSVTPQFGGGGLSTDVIHHSAFTNNALERPALYHDKNVDIKRNIKPVQFVHATHALYKSALRKMSMKSGYSAFDTVNLQQLSEVDLQRQNSWTIYQQLSTCRHLRLLEIVAVEFNSDNYFTK